MWFATHLADIFTLLNSIGVFIVALKQKGSK